MAAPPPSEQSPSNKEMHRSSRSPGDEDRAKDPPPSSPPVSSPAPGAATATVAPTYRSSETSESYVLAKQLLNADNFEEALAVVEEQLIATTAAVRTGTAASGTTGGDGNDDERRIELHESLAPLHYLYGTTLLYSLEEAKDDGNDTGAMMTDAAKEASTTTSATTATPTSTTPLDLRQQLSSAADASASPPSQEDSAMAEDIQIAWENLEAARTIVEQMLLLRATESGSSSGGSASDLPVAKLQLDLAQIHLREGDLQRINGNYTSAVEDYSRCLEILLKHNNTRDEDNNPRALDRKIADTQFNLGLTYLTSSSDLQKELANSGNDNKTGDGGNTQKAALLAREHCAKGIQQHVDCAKTFCGILANLCGVDPETVASPATGAESVDAAPPSAKPAAGFKTTGLEPDQPAGSAAAAAASQTLNVWRKAVATVVAAHAPPGPEDSLRVSDIVQVLDEIQETVDEAERSQEGVRQAAQIRLQAQHAAAGEDGGVVANPDGSTTTIGFGTPPAVKAAAASGAEGDSSASAKPVMMVVKKKKKRKDLVAVGGNTDGDDGANKRSKTD